MLVLRRIQVSAPLRLSCVRTSGSRPYLGLCNLDFCQGCFSGSPSRRGGPEADGMDGGVHA